ncbi:MAG: GTP-binding protein [Methylibium sp. NZG]|nr:MAG: GTP-binding protein [Methylibium sp. NZG]
MTAPGTVSLSLVSHTNAGKTTLARTLLARDVGTVRDAPHVTEFADAFTLLQSPLGETLRLWDTPGFGDSVRLAKRMRQSGNPVGWFLSEVWDRWRDRPFWSSQQALRNVREQADVVLYLVNAAEEPAAAGYVAPEMELLAWVGKPVIVLLNQLGAPREAALEEADVQRWREHLAADAHARSQVRAVLPLDAFARCWVQEYTLLQAIAQALPDAQRSTMRRLSDAWLAQRRDTFDAAMDALAHSLARIALSRAAVPEAAGLRARLRQVGAALGMGQAEEGPQAAAQRALAESMDAELRASTAQLIALHGLDGQAQGEILQRLATHYEMRVRLSEGNAAALGGVLTGALAGLKADVATGGLTLGGGMLAGGILGALGAAGLARAYNLVRGTEQSWLTWNAEAMNRMLDAALLRYLAVAHFGRGRGDWAQGESPPHWKVVVEEAVAPYADALDEVWGDRSASGDAAAQAAEAERLAGHLQPLLRELMQVVLRRLYPTADALDTLQPHTDLAEDSGTILSA